MERKFTGNETFAVPDPKQVITDQVKPSQVRSRTISRQDNKSQAARYVNNRNESSDAYDDTGDTFDDSTDGFVDGEQGHGKRVRRSERPKGARKRRRKRFEELNEQQASEPHTPYVSEENSDSGNYGINRSAEKTVDHHSSSKEKGHKSEGKLGKKTRSSKGPWTSTPKSSPLSPGKDNSPVKEFTDKAAKSSEVTPVRHRDNRKVEKKESIERPANKPGRVWENSRKQVVDGVKIRHKRSTSKLQGKESRENSTEICSTDGDTSIPTETERRKGKDRMANKALEYTEEESSAELGNTPKRYKKRYRNDDYAHSKIRENKTDSKDRKTDGSDINEIESNKVAKSTKATDRLYERKPLVGGDRRKRSSFSAFPDHTQVYRVSFPFSWLCCCCWLDCFVGTFDVVLLVWLFG